MLYLYRENVAHWVHALRKLPLEEPVIKHSKFVDVRQRAESGIEDVLYFVERLVFFL